MVQSNDILKKDLFIHLYLFPLCGLVHFLLNAPISDCLICVIILIKRHLDIIHGRHKVNGGQIELICRVCFDLWSRLFTRNSAKSPSL